MSIKVLYSITVGRLGSMLVDIEEYSILYYWLIPNCNNAKDGFGSDSSLVQGVCVKGTKSLKCESKREIIVHKDYGWVVIYWLEV